jgi:hypothetical protein
MYIIVSLGYVMAAEVRGDPLTHMVIQAVKTLSYSI